MGGGDGLLALPGRLGERAWRLFTNVRFAILLILGIVVAGAIGTVVRQFPDAALYDPTRYAAELAEMHRRWDSIAVGDITIGPLLVEVADRLGFFRVFSAWWVVLLLTMLVISIVCCTLKRLPKLWRESRPATPVMPASFFDIRLANRAEVVRTGMTRADLEDVLRRNRFGVRAQVGDGHVIHLIGERNRRTRLATLISHLGLIGFLVGGLVTAMFGFDTVLFLGNGQSAPIRPIGAPDNLIVENTGFEAPQRADGSFSDFRTDLAVYRDGEQIARRIIRVNEPLEVGGYVFHQNTFGPAVDLRIVDPSGRPVWIGSMILDGFFQGRPQGFLPVPGSEIGLFVVLDRAPDSRPLLAVEGMPLTPDGSATTARFAAAIGLGESIPSLVTEGYQIEFVGTSSWTGLVIKRDPGEWFIWISFALLLTGLTITFYLPRVRIWGRLTDDAVQLAVVADRFVDTRRELERVASAVARITPTGDGSQAPR